MLPILRILPVGGVLLAILILVLALSPPDGSRAPLSPEVVPTRSAFLDRDRRPEARQFLIHAALKRADELSRLRDLPDTPVRSDAEEPKVAALPGDRSESDPDEPASINETPGVSIPMEVGEPSASELPVAAPEANATKNPDQAKREVRRRVHRARYARPAPPPPRPFNFFEALFGGPQYQQAYANQQANPRYPQPTPTYGPQTAYGSTYGTPQTAYGTGQQPGQRYPSPQTNPAIVPVVPGSNSY
jgi:hypothetical protein